MRVLHVITSLQVGGAEKLMVDLLPRFKKEGIDVDLCLFYGKETGFYKQLESQGIKIISLNDTPSYYSFKNINKLKKLISEYDIVHTHNTACQLLGAIAKSGTTKLVTTEHNTTNRRRSIKALYPIDRWMYSRYDKIICISPSTRDNLVSYISPCANKSIVINNGVDVSRYTDAKASVSHEEIVVTMVAAFRPQKDHETILETLKLLPLNYRLWLVGDGERRQEIESICVQLGLKERVRFWGNRDDVPELLKSSDINVLSSNWEGFGLVAVEGMASGKPFIASDVDGLKEVVGEAGILFEQGNPKDLAAKILQLATDKELYSMVAKRCLERSMLYDISCMARQYMQVYKSL